MYWVWIVAGLLACWLCLMGQCRADDRPLRTAAIATAFAAVLGLIAAKAGYVLLFVRSTLAIDGLWALVETRPNTFSLFGAVAGMMLGALLSAKVLGVRASVMMDRFTPCAALALGFLRAGEGMLGTIGAGGFVSPESWAAHFPILLMSNAYGEQLFAVYRLEAIIAFACAAVLLFKKNGRPGCKTELGLCLLALSQIFCESLRARCMKWGFVRVEQLLCAVTALGFVVYACRNMRNVRLRWLPVVLCVLGIGVAALMEYALDKTDIPEWGCYLLSLAALLVMAGAEIRAVCSRRE